MRLSKLEFLAMNNPVKRMLQRYVEFRIFRQHLKKHNVVLTGKAILDAGCGSGYGTNLILKTFTPSKLVAFDFMSEQIELAKKRHIAAELFIGDMTKIDLPSHNFDAVFVFNVLHHIPEWKKALAELARMLKTGGILLIEDIGQKAANLSELIGFCHPKETSFDLREFEDELKHVGFEILEQKKIFGISSMKSYLCKNNL